MKIKSIYYPQNLDIIKIINDDQILNDDQKRISLMFPQRILYPISNIISKTSHIKDKKSIDNFVNINTEIIKSILGKRFYFILTFLIRNNIIIRNENRKYKVGERSYEYRLSDRYIDSILIKESIIDKTLLNNLNKQLVIDTQLKSFIYNNLLKLKINGGKAIEELNNKLNEILETKKIGGEYISLSPLSLYVAPGNEILETKKIGGEYISLSPLSLYVAPGNEISNEYIYDYFDSIKDLINISDDRIKDVYNNWFVNISMIIEGDIFLTEGKQSKRYYTNITSLPRELRNCLYLPEDYKINILTPKLIEIDIRNSQPLFFNYFLQKEYDLDNTLFDELDDVKLYIELTSKGEFYNYLMDKWNIKERDTFKQMMFGQIFYCNSSSNFRNEYSILFSILFPNVMKLILKMKEKNYKDLVVKLQRLEAECIIDNVIKIFMNKYPNEFISSVHDSIIIDEKHKDEIIDIIYKSLKLKELKPTLKIKELI